MTKRIEYRGELFTVEDWGKVITTDKDGSVAVWSSVPCIDFRNEHWYAPYMDIQFAYLKFSDSDTVYSSWDKSCKRI
jgi:hypothetical protein